MKRNKFYDILYIILILSLIAFMIWIVHFMRSEARECVRDPINYYDQKMEHVECSRSLGNVMCFAEQGYVIKEDKEDFENP